jgi:hypothetical protein
MCLCVTFNFCYTQTLVLYDYFPIVHFRLQRLRFFYGPSSGGSRYLRKSRTDQHRLFSSHNPISFSLPSTQRRKKDRRAIDLMSWPECPIRRVPGRELWKADCLIVYLESGAGGRPLLPLPSLVVFPLCNTIMRQQKGHIRQSDNRPISDSRRSLCVPPLQLLLDSFADKPVVLKTKSLLKCTYKEHPLHSARSLLPTLQEYNQQ